MLRFAKNVVLWCSTRARTSEIQKFPKPHAKRAIRPHLTLLLIPFFFFFLEICEGNEGNIFFWTGVQKLICALNFF